MLAELLSVSTWYVRHRDHSYLSQAKVVNIPVVVYYIYGTRTTQAFFCRHLEKVSSLGGPGIIGKTSSVHQK